MNKKKIILTIITFFLLIVVSFLLYMLFNKYTLKINFENYFLPFANKNENIIFKIDKIVLFSGCDAKNKNATNTNFTIENLYQYTDIALFISSENENKTSENTFKKVYINNINYTTTPSIGEQKLYYKNINNFARSEINEDNLINNNLEFYITSDDDANLDIPTLYNNLANPVVVSYVNSNIKTDYTLLDTSNPITYDGSLLKRCNISTNDIACSFSFDIYVVNNLDQEFKCTVHIDVPLQADDKTIYDGSVILKNDSNYTFYRYK